MFVACPHCNFEVINDGTMGGEPVACPNCGGHFRMPGPPQAAPPISPGEFIPPSSRPTKRIVKKYGIAHSPIGTTKQTFGGAFGLTAGAGLGCMAVVFLCVVLFCGGMIALFVIGSAADRSTRSTPPPATWER